MHYKFSRELLGTVLKNEKDQLETLLAENFEEGKTLKEFFPLDVDWEKLLVLEKAGNLGAYSVRWEDSLVGYAIILADTHIHHKSVVFAKIDTIFIQKKHRKGGCGYRFMKYLTRVREDLGVQSFSVSAKMDHSFNKLLSKLEFVPVDTYYTKVMK